MSARKSVHIEERVPLSFGESENSSMPSSLSSNLLCCTLLFIDETSRSESVLSFPLPVNIDGFSHRDRQCSTSRSTASCPRLLILVLTVGASVGRLPGVGVWGVVPAAKLLRVVKSAGQTSAGRYGQLVR